MRPYWLVSTLVAAVVFAACGSSDEPTGGSSSGSEDAATSNPTSTTSGPVETTAEPPPAATNVVDDSVLVVFEVSGGFSGREDRLVLSRSGDIDVVRGGVARVGSVSSADVAEIEELLRSSGVFDGPVEATGEGADLQTYVITYAGVTVVFDDVGLPAELVPVVDRLEAVLGP